MGYSPWQEGTCSLRPSSGGKQEDLLATAPLGGLELGWFLGLPVTPPGRSWGPPASQVPWGGQEGGAAAAILHLCQGGRFG